MYLRVEDSLRARLRTRYSQNLLCLTRPFRSGKRRLRHWWPQFSLAQLSPNALSRIADSILILSRQTLLPNLLSPSERFPSVNSPRAASSKEHSSHRYSLASSPPIPGLL